MPIVNETNDAPPVQAPAPIRISAPPHQSAVVDTRYTPLQSLITYMEGSIWTVDYFSQVVNNDDQLQGQNLELPASLQQYKVIRGLQLKVTSPLRT